MSQNDPTKIFFGVNLVPNSTSIVQNLGDLDVTVDGKLNFDNGTSASPVVTEAQPATLTNKTIDGNLNTLLNIPLSSVDSVAVLKALQSDASGLITASAVSASELAELSGILSKATGVSDTQTLTNKTINGSNNTITNVSLTTGVTGVLPETNGGTGISTVNTGDILYASSTNALSNLGIGTTGQVLKTVAGLPSWAASNVTQNIRSVSVNTTLTTSDNIVLVNASSGSVNIILPSAAADAAVILYIQKTDSSVNAVNILAGAGDTIQGLSSASLISEYETIEIVSNGITNWTILNNGQPNPVPISAGGTGVSSLSSGDLLFGGASTVTALSQLPSKTYLPMLGAVSSSVINDDLGENSFPIAVANSSVTITTSGRPVALFLQPSSGATNSYILLEQGNGATELNLYVTQGARTVYTASMGTQNGNIIRLPPGVVSCIDFNNPGGTNTYGLQWFLPGYTGGAAEIAFISSATLVAYEL